MVLLMYVEQEYPNNAIVMEIKPYNIRLINLIKEKVGLTNCTIIISGAANNWCGAKKYHFIHLSDALQRVVKG